MSEFQFMFYIFQMKMAMKSERCGGDNRHQEHRHHVMSSVFLKDYSHYLNKIPIAKLTCNG